MDSREMSATERRQVIAKQLAEGVVRVAKARLEHASDRKKGSLKTTTKPHREREG